MKEKMKTDGKDIPVKVINDIHVENGQKFYMFIDTVGDYNPFGHGVVRDGSWTNPLFQKVGYITTGINKLSQRLMHAANVTEKDKLANSNSMKSFSKKLQAALFEDGHKPVEQRVFFLPYDAINNDFEALPFEHTDENRAVFSEMYLCTKGEKKKSLLSCCWM